MPDSEEHDWIPWVTTSHAGSEQKSWKCTRCKIVMIRVDQPRPDQHLQITGVGRPLAKGLPQYRGGLSCDEVIVKRIHDA